MSADNEIPPEKARANIRLALALGVLAVAIAGLYIYFTATQG